MQPAKIARAVRPKAEGITSLATEILRSTHNFWLERRLDLPVGDLLPIDPPEELVSLDVLLALVPASKTLGGILDQKLKRRETN